MIATKISVIYLHTVAIKKFGKKISGNLVGGLRSKIENIFSSFGTNLFNFSASFTFFGWSGAWPFLFLNNSYWITNAVVIRDIIGEQLCIAVVKIDFYLRWNCENTVKINK